MNDQAETAPDHPDVVSLRGDVRECTAHRVELAAVGVSKRVEVFHDGSSLIGGPREDIGEATGGEIGGGLRGASSPADGGHAACGLLVGRGRRSKGGGRDSLGAARGKGRDKLTIIIAGLEQRAGDTTVAGSEQDGGTPGAELHVGITEGAERRYISFSK